MRLPRGRRRALFAALAGALLLAGVVLLLGKAAGYAKLLDELEHADGWWLAVGLAGEAAAFAGYVLAFRGVARFDGGPGLGLGAMTRVVFASLGATRLFATAGAGGLALDYWALRKAGVPRQESVVRVIALNAALYGVFGAGAWVAAAALALGAGSGAPVAMTVPWLVLIPSFFLAAAHVSAPSRRERRVREGGRLRRALAVAVAAVSLVRKLASRPAANAGTLAGAALYWAGDAVCLWAALQAFGVEVSVAALVLAYATGYVAMLLPLPTGGVGGVDAAMTFALTAVGVGLAPALLGVFAYRLVSFWLPTLPGAIAFATLPKLGRDLAAARAPARLGR